MMPVTIMNIRISNAVPRLKTLLPALAAAALCLSPAARAAKLKLPPWLAEASQRQVSTMTKETTAVVLHNEKVISIAPSGRMTITVRQARRIVTRDGRSEASTGISYDSSTEKITDFKAWLVQPGGEGKSYGIRDAVDAALSREAVYSDSRQLWFAVGAEAYENHVYGCEYTVEGRGVFAAERWVFASEHPVALSFLTYKMPKGWSVTAKTFNHAEIAPVVKADTYTWELRDLAPVKNEPLSPSGLRTMPHVTVDVVPPAGMKNPPLLTFPDWKAVSVYFSNQYLKPTRPDAALEAKARELLATAGPGLWNRINALCRCAQAINYVEISTNLGRGGGYIPRDASDVLKTGYGVCRDKVGLLCALFTAAGIESYPAMAYSGDRYQVTEEWPSPEQFNHVITAIKIDDPSIQSPLIIKHPVFGRLLFFDPTDYYTPLGDMEYRNQGSLVLMLAGEQGGLVRLPFTSPQANHLDRTVTAQITSAGAIAGRVEEHSTGQAAAQERSLYRSTRMKFSDVIRDWINFTVRAAKLIKVDAVDEQEQGRFTMTAEFVAPGYAQSMKGNLLVFKPAIVDRRDFTLLTEPDRKYPIVIEPRSWSEASDIIIPDGFKVDYLPPPVETQASFGRYTAGCEYDSQTHQVRYRRTLVMNAAEIPASDYATVRAFYETIRKAEQTRVVLGRVE